jgi:hypothetical protein
MEDWFSFIQQMHIEGRQAANPWPEFTSLYPQVRSFSFYNIKKVSVADPV